MQRGRDFRGHRDAAAGQRQNHRILALISLEGFCHFLPASDLSLNDMAASLCGPVPNNVYVGVAALDSCKIALKPAQGSVDHHFHRARFGKEMARARHNLERLWSAQPDQGLLIEFDHAVIRAPDDQERRRF